TVAGVDFSHRAAVNGDVTTAARQALAGALSNLLGGRRAEVRVRSIPPGASITIDGNEAGEAPVITELDIGSHSFRATLEGHRPANERVDIAEDQDVELRLEPYPVEPVPSSSAGMRIAGFSLLGAGAVGLSLTLALTLSDLGCQDSRPNGCFDDREIAAGPFALWMGLSSAAMITGLVLVLAAPKRNASVSLRPTGADFRMRF
ncbi:MAG: PEGA domain-containing protein, partial [Myxococcota bacterium]